MLFRLVTAGTYVLSAFFAVDVGLESFRTRDGNLASQALLLLFLAGLMLWVMCEEVNNRREPEQAEGIDPCDS